MSVERPESLKPIHNLFPVSEQAATASFESIFNALEKREGDFLLEKIRVFKTENKELFDLFSEMASSIYQITKNDSLVHHYLLGALLGYTTLREEAFSQGGTLPVISDEIIRTNIRDSLGIEKNLEEFAISLRRKEDLEHNIEILKNSKEDMIEKFVKEEPELTIVINNYISKIEKPTEAYMLLMSFLTIHSIFKTNHEVEKIRSIFES